MEGEKKKTEHREKRSRGTALDAQNMSNIDHSILSIRRVTRVVPGGRRFSFAVSVAVGDRNGSVGCGTGKASDTSSAIAKATAKAKKQMKKISITEDGGIAHSIDAKYCASKVLITPSVGLICGGAVRKMFDLAGIKNANGKLLSRSKNHTNNARATLKALEKIRV